MSGMHAFRFTAGLLAGEEFAFLGRTPEEADGFAAAWVASESSLVGAAWEMVPEPVSTVELPVENPRWTRCREALGREPSTTDFICWMTSWWEDYAKERGYKDSSEMHARLGPDVHPAFDAWLTAGVAAGKWTEARA